MQQLIPPSICVLSNTFNVVHVPSLKVFTVSAPDENVHVVKLYPKENCMCPSSTMCCHILAVKRSIGVKCSKRKIINLTKLRHNSRMIKYEDELLMITSDNKVESFIKWLDRKQMKYYLPEIQNEMIEIMAHRILHVISSKIQLAGFYTIMVDEMTDNETGDSSDLEHLVIFFRWMDDSLQIHEDFIGLHSIEVYFKMLF
ncbi:uncharacterized protein LOC105843127 [Hydra vulgaris]|uniref:uncharacterized protein LOC105843127 n=1 Tax=Hydra vulgaris TaxID=6087 RepID=UPI0032EA20DB